ncbi:fibronectin type III domain-containing protein [Dactylosporangium sp. NPDC050588]|uniref:fibronectin type III domain-containing protein n=1 Tax=Dactylosporangium sp. NPDC050588 TaxID=3157211 RepID=UPI0034115E59
MTVVVTGDGMRAQSGLTSSAAGRRRARTGLALVTAGLAGLMVTGGPAFAGLMGGGTASPGPSGAAVTVPAPAPAASSKAPKTQPRTRPSTAAPSGADPAGGKGPAGSKRPAGSKSPGNSKSPTGGAASGHVPLDADGNPADAVVDDATAAGPGAEPGPAPGDPSGDTGAGDSASAGSSADPSADEPTGTGPAATDPASGDPSDSDATDTEPAGDAGVDVNTAGVMAAIQAPTGVVAVAVPGGLRVTWTHDGTGVDHYVATAYDQQGSVAGSCLGATAGAGTCEIDVGVAAGGSYTVKVVAYGGAGASDPSAPATSGVVVAGPPAAPTGVHATATSATSMRVGWTRPAAPAAGVDRYVVTAVQDASKTCATGDGATTWCLVTGLEPGTAYTFRVVAQGAGGDSAPSAASAPVVAGGPAAQSTDVPEPVNLVVTPGDQKLLVEWRAPWDPDHAVGGYTVHVEEEPGRDCVTTHPTCTIEGLANGTSYTVSVRSDGAVSGESGWVTATGTPSVAPGEPTAVTAEAKIEAITVSWIAGAPGTGVARFQALATAPGGDHGVCETVTGNSCTISGLKWGDTYSVMVMAIGRHGRNSAWSEPAKVAVPHEVTVPADLPAGIGHFGGSSGDEVAPGELFTVTGSGFAPHSTVKVAVYSTPIVLATTMTDGAGTFSAEVSVPEVVKGGPHTLVAAGVDTGGEPRFLTMAVTVAVEYEATAFGDAGGSVLAVTGDPVGRTAGAGAALVIAGMLLVGASRRFKH